MSQVRVTVKVLGASSRVKGRVTPSAARGEAREAGREGDLGRMQQGAGMGAGVAGGK